MTMSVIDPDIGCLPKPVIPVTVMGQLRLLCMNQNPEVAAKAEKALELIEKRKKETGDIRFVKSQKDAIEILMSPSDNSIVSVVSELKCTGKHPVLVTTDRNMGMVAAASGIETVNPVWDELAVFHCYS